MLFIVREACCGSCNALLPPLCLIVYLGLIAVAATAAAAAAAAPDAATGASRVSLYSINVCCPSCCCPCCCCCSAAAAAAAPAAAAAAAGAPFCCCPVASAPVAAATPAAAASPCLLLLLLTAAAPAAAAAYLSQQPCKFSILAEAPSLLLLIKYVPCLHDTLLSCNALSWDNDHKLYSWLQVEYTKHQSKHTDCRGSQRTASLTLSQQHEQVLCPKKLRGSSPYDCLQIRDCLHDTPISWTTHQVRRRWLTPVGSEGSRRINAYLPYCVNHTLSSLYICSSAQG